MCFSFLVNLLFFLIMTEIKNLGNLDLHKVNTLLQWQALISSGDQGQVPENGWKCAKEV